VACFVVLILPTQIFADWTIYGADSPGRAHCYAYQNTWGGRAQLAVTRSGNDEYLFSIQTPLEIRRSGDITLQNANGTGKPLVFAGCFKECTWVALLSRAEMKAIIQNDHRSYNVWDGFDADTAERYEFDVVGLENALAQLDRRICPFVGRQ
jgi:hypothetical protein